MPPIKPTKRKDLIANLRKLGWDGPFSGGKHQHMKKADRTLTIPNPHKGDISQVLLVKLLKLELHAKIGNRYKAYLMKIRD